MDRYTLARQLFEQFQANLRTLFLPIMRRIKDVDSWSGAASNYESTDAYCAACLIDVNAAAGRETKAQSHCMLPVRGPGDSADTYVRQAVHAAAGGHGISQVKRPDDVPEADWTKAVKAAARKLEDAYGQMEEDVPESVSSLARGIPESPARPAGAQRAISMSTIYTLVFDKLYGAGDYWMESDDYLVDLYEDGGALYALIANNGKLYRVALEINEADVSLGEKVQVMEEHTPVSTRTTVIRQADGRRRWLSVSATSVLNRVGEIDADMLFDSFIKHAEETGEYPIRMFFHMGEHFRTGQADFLARDGHCYITSGLFDDTELGNRDADSLENQASYWGESIGYIPVGEPDMVPIGGYKIPVYRNGINREISTLPESMAASLFTAPQVITREVKRMLTGERWKAFVQLFNGDEAAARAWLEANPDETNRTIEGAGMITRQAGDSGAQSAGTPAADAGATQPTGSPAGQDLEIGDDVITAVVERLSALPQITDMAGQIGEVLTDIQGLRTRLDEALAAVNGRLEALEQSEEDKRRQFMEDLPPARGPRLHYQPRQRPAASPTPTDPAGEKTMAEIAAETAVAKKIPNY